MQTANKLPADPTKRISLKASAVYTTLSSVVRLVVTILTAPVLIRIFGLERYGVWAVLLSMLGIVFLIQPTWDGALTNYLAAAFAHQDQVSMRQTAGTALALFMAWAGVATPLFVLLSPWLVAHSLATQPDPFSLEVALGMLGISILPRTVQQWAVACEAGLQRFDLQAQIESASLVMLNVGDIVLAWLTRDLVWLAAWQLVVSTGTALTHVIILQLHARQRLMDLRFSRKLVQPLNRFGVVQWGTNVGFALFSQADRLLVNAFLGAAAVGIYAPLTAVASKINELSAAPLGSLASAFSAAVARVEWDRIRRLYLRSIHLNGLMVYSLGVGLLVGQYFVVRLLFPVQYAQQAMMVLQLLVPIYGLYSLSAPAHFAGLGLRRPELNAAAAIIGGAATLALMVVLIPRLQLAGAALGNAGFILTYFAVLIAGRLMGLKFREPFFASLPAGLSLILLSVFVNFGYATVLTQPWWLVLAVLLSVLPPLWIDRPALMDMLSWLKDRLSKFASPAL